MSEIRFYHLLRQRVERALPALVGKALGTGKTIVVKTVDTQRVEFLNDALWTQDVQGFLPHGSAKDGHAADQPVWITDQDDVPNGARILICVDGAEVTTPEDFDLCCYVFDGNSDQAVHEARAKWKTYADQDLDMTYWQQTEQGWQKKA